MSHKSEEVMNLSRIEKLPPLKKISLTFINEELLRLEDIQPLDDPNSIIVNLNLNCNKIFDLGGLASETTNRFKYLKEINLSDNRISNQSFEYFEKLGNRRESLQYMEIVNLSVNKISEISGGFLIFIQMLRNVKILILSYNKIKTLSGIQHLGGKTEKSKNSLHLDFVGNYISNLKDLSYLKKLKRLKVLHFQKKNGVHQNKICRNENYSKSVTTVIPNLAILDGIRISEGNDDVFSDVYKGYGMYSKFDSILSENFDDGEDFKVVSEDVDLSEKSSPRRFLQPKIEKKASVSPRSKLDFSRIDNLLSNRKRILKKREEIETSMVKMRENSKKKRRNTPSFLQENLSLSNTSFDSDLFEPPTVNKLEISSRDERRNEDNINYRRELDKALKELGKTKAYIQDREKVIAEEVTKNRKLEKKVKEVQEETKHHLNSINQLNNVVADVRIERERWTKEMLLKDNDIINLKRELGKSERKNKDLEDAVGKLDKHAESMKLNQEEKVKLYEKIRTENEDFRTKIFDLEKKNREEEEKNRVKENELKEAKEIINAKEIKNQNDLDESSKKFKVQFETVTKNYQNTIKQMNEQFNKQLEERERERDRLILEHKDGIDEVKALKEKEIGEIKRNTEIEIERERKKVNILEEVINEEKERFSKLKNLLSKSVEKELKMTNLSNSLKKILEEMKQQINKLLENKYNIIKENKGRTKDLNSIIKELRGKLLNYETLELPKIQVLNEKLKRGEDLLKEKENEVEKVIREKNDRLKTINEKEIEKMKTVHSNTIKKLREKHKIEFEETKKKLNLLENRFEVEMNEMKTKIMVKDKFLKDRDDSIEKLKEKTNILEDVKSDLLVNVNNLEIQIEENKDNSLDFKNIIEDLESNYLEEKKRRKQYEEELEKNFENIEIVERETKEKYKNVIIDKERIFKEEKMELMEKYDMKIQSLHQTVVNQEEQIKLCIKSIKKKQLENLELKKKIKKFKNLIQNI